MRETIRKYGFAAAVAAAFAGVAGFALVRTIADGGAANATAGPGGPGGGRGPGGAPAAPLVATVLVTEDVFYDSAPAIGTAEAWESVTITSKVTDVIQRIAFESGDRVAKGAVLVELASVEQRADLAEAQAALVAEEREYNRFKELADRGFAPAAQLEAARAAYESAQARVNALRSRIADRVIRAPFAGVMGLREASPGALAQPGEPIATLDDVSRIKLDFDIPEPQIALARAGAQVAATTPAFPGEEFTGVIEQIDSRIDPTTRTLTVRAVLPNPDGRLKPGMLMSVEVRASERKALSVPELAVVESGSESAVFRIEEKDGATIVVRTAVRTGERSGGRIEVLEGLAAGDRVVSEGVQRVRSGQPVSLGTAAAPSEPART